ncbi:MAG: hypothetical protein ACI81V_000495 [Lentimonas sp.]|jgi:hypothetical protein
MHSRPRRLCKIAFALSLLSLGATTVWANATPEELGKLQAGNLIYGSEKKTSVCFADRFIAMVGQQTNLIVGNKFFPVELGSPQLFDLPFCIFSGEGSFSLSEAERTNLRAYLSSGGFILASPSCSNKDWERSFRNELELCLPEHTLGKIPMTHPIFSMIHKIERLQDKKGKPVTLLGLTINGRLVLVHSPEGLNDVSNAEGCCCCGGNEIKHPEKVNINIFTYAAVY